MTISELKRQMEDYPDNANIQILTPDGDVLGIRNTGTEPSNDEAGLTFLISTYGYRERHNRR